MIDEPFRQWLARRGSAPAAALAPALAARPTLPDAAVGGDAPAPSEASDCIEAGVQTCMPSAVPKGEAATASPGNVTAEDEPGVLTAAHAPSPAAPLARRPCEGGLVVLTAW